MVIKDEHGMAVLVDAVLFLAALSVISALMCVPHPAEEADETQAMVESFHAVMLVGETSGNGSALSQTDLASFLVLAAMDGVMSEEEVTHLDQASSGTLREANGIWRKVWWVVCIGDEERLFGQSCDGREDVYADQRSLGYGVVCTLYVSI